MGKPDGKMSRKEVAAAVEYVWTRLPQQQRETLAREALGLIVRTALANSRLTAIIQQALKEKR